MTKKGFNLTRPYEEYDALFPESAADAIKRIAEGNHAQEANASRDRLKKVGLVVTGAALVAAAGAADMFNERDIAARDARSETESQQLVVNGNPDTFNHPPAETTITINLPDNPTE